jgi:glycerophosphoryl diester phosphodiesterase
MTTSYLDLIKKDRMNIKYLYLFGFLLLLYGCTKETSVPIPSAGSSSFIKETDPLQEQSKLLMEGVYQVTSGSSVFGDQIVIKWNHSGVLFTCYNGKHFIMQAGHLDSVIFIQGYWRDGYSDETGLCNMYIAKSEGGSAIVSGNTASQIIIRGAFGNDNGLPDQTFTLQYIRPFSEKVLNSNFYILAHRCGGRNSDHLPVSENSIAMVKFTESLGTTGVECDPRITSDGVAFIYHDNDINTRLTKKGPLAGDIASYTWRQLSTFVRLIHGEKIPSVDELLTYVVDSTSMRFVYLDMKDAAAVPVVIPLQLKALQRAKEKGRDVLIVMGIPTTDVLNALLSYPDYQNVPTLCELTLDDFKTAHSVVWAPRWTLGTQNDLVQQVHDLDPKNVAICWTVDSPNWIRDYLDNGHFDGLLTNFPYVEAYYHYIQE